MTDPIPHRVPSYEAQQTQAYRDLLDSNLTGQGFVEEHKTISKKYMLERIGAYNTVEPRLTWDLLEFARQTWRELSPQQAKLVSIIEKHREITIQGLARSARVSAQVAKAQISRLERQGLVSKKSSPDSLNQYLLTDKILDAGLMINRVSNQSDRRNELEKRFPDLQNWVSATLENEACETESM